MKAKIKQRLDNIIMKLPDNLTLSKEVLNYLDNSATKVVFDDDIKGSYYVFLNDTIYITKNNSSKSTKEFSRLTVICHECIHSIQSKILHGINFVLSNIEVIVFIVCLILKLFNMFGNIVNVVYPVFCFICIIPRIILENDAIDRSFDLTELFLEKYNVPDTDVLYFTSYLKSQTLISKVSNILSFTVWKIIKILIIIIV